MSLDVTIDHGQPLVKMADGTLSLVTPEMIIKAAANRGADEFLWRPTFRSVKRPVFGGVATMKYHCV